MTSRYVQRIDHVQLAMPPGGEALARQFYGGVLGIPERPKPPALAPRGGCWFGAGALEVHLGVEADFRPARKAHPAFEVAHLDELIAACRAAGHEVRDGAEVEGRRRAFLDDPFGNRIELIEAGGPASSAGSPRVRTESPP